MYLLADGILLYTNRFPVSAHTSVDIGSQYIIYISSGRTLIHIFLAIVCVLVKTTTGIFYLNILLVISEPMKYTACYNDSNLMLLSD